jgi:effector-binding domain-containing protein
MKALGKLLGIVLLLVIVGGGAAFFLLPKAATKSETVAIPKPAATVYALLANTPASGATIGDGVTAKLKAVTPPDTVVFDVLYKDGTQGEATYKVVADGDKGSKVTLTLKKPVSDAPAERISALTGAPAEPFLTAATAQLKTDAGQLNGEPLTGLAYEIVHVDPQGFIYAEGESAQDAAEIKAAVAQLLSTVDGLIKSTGLQKQGAPIAVETAWKEDKYEFNAGWRVSGTPPKIYLKSVHSGQSPSGTAMKVLYKGSEENVIPTYDKMEDLVRAAHLKLGESFEVYNDDPTKPGGSVDREIYYLIEGEAADVQAALSKILPATAAAPPTTQVMSSAPPISVAPSVKP